MSRTWKNLILDIVDSLDGRSVSLQEIYRRVSDNPIVTDYHREPWSSGGQPRFECWTRRALTDLVREGKLKRITTGMYSRK